MDSGRFIVAIVIAIILVGGLAYYENTQLTALSNRITVVQSKAENAETAATEAQAAAAEAKKTAAGMTADLDKAGAISTLVKQATDAANAATQAADQAKEAVTQADVAKAKHR